MLALETVFLFEKYYEQVPRWILSKINHLATFVLEDWIKQSRRIFIPTNVEFTEKICPHKVFGRCIVPKWVHTCTKWVHTNRKIITVLWYWYTLLPIVENVLIPSTWTNILIGTFFNFCTSECLNLHKVSKI